MIGWEPDFDLLDLSAPFQCGLVGTVIQVDVIPLDIAAPVLDYSISISRNVHDRAERENAGVGGDGAITGLGTTGGYTYRLGFPLVGSA